MRQALHIFKKDVRHLWPAILVVVTLTALFTYLGAYSVPAVRQGASKLDLANGLVLFLMPLGWAYLIAATVHEEVLPGDQQFWLTRPYSWKSLLAAKGLFIVAFVNVPMMLAACVIVQIQGFHIAAYWINLICWQILLTAVWLMPFAALAAVTRNLRQFFVTVLAIAVISYLLELWSSQPALVRSHPFPFYLGLWLGAMWIDYFIVIAVLVTAALLILFLQYSRRRTTIARAISICAVILVFGIPQLLTMQGITALQFRLSKSQVDASSLRITMDLDRKPPKTVSHRGYRGTIQVDIPVRVTGLADGMDLYSDRLTTVIEGPDGKVAQAVGWIVHQDDGYWQEIYVDVPVFQQLKGKQATLRTSTYLTLLGDEKRTQVEPAERQEVAGLGICMRRASNDAQEQVSRGQRDSMLVCFSPFRSPSLFTKTFFVMKALFGNLGESYPEIGPGSYSPYPAEGGISPLVVSIQSNWSSSEPMKVTVATEVPLAHARRDFEVRGLRLGDYAIE